MNYYYYYYYVHAHYQNSTSHKLIWVLSRNFQRTLKEENHLTKRQYMNITAKYANNTVTATYIATTFGAKNIVIAMADCIKLKLSGLDEIDVLQTKRQ